MDILVNNAGAIPQGSVTALDEKTWREAWDLKVFGFINLIREIYPTMCERRRGVIVNVIGVAGERPDANYIAGSMGNASLMAHDARARARKAPSTACAWSASIPAAPRPTARSCAGARARRRSSAAPIAGASSRRAFRSAGSRTVDEVANMIVFLCSDLSSYTTGTVITVDGGASWRSGVSAKGTALA